MAVIRALGLTRNHIKFDFVTSKFTRLVAGRIRSKVGQKIAWQADPMGISIGRSPSKEQEGGKTIRKGGRLNQRLHGCKGDSQKQ